jgi:hypothetical protein
MKLISSSCKTGLGPMKTKHLTTPNRGFAIGSSETGMQLSGDESIEALLKLLQRSLNTSGTLDPKETNQARIRNGK